MTTSRSLPILLLLATSGVACRPAAVTIHRPSDVQVRDIQLGRAVGEDKRVREPADDFGPADTVYASVVTEGTASEARLRARWSYGGSQLLEETEQRIAPQGTSVSEFHVRNPAGWTPGAYQVEILLDGASVGARTFTVEAGGP
jgi:hypothetical protein